MARGSPAVAAPFQEPQPRCRQTTFGPRFYGSQGLTHHRVVDLTNGRFVGLYEVHIFSVSKNGENGHRDEGADGATLPEFLGYNRPWASLSLFALLCSLSAFHHNMQHLKGLMGQCPHASSSSSRFPFQELTAYEQQECMIHYLQILIESES